MVIDLGIVFCFNFWVHKDEDCYKKNILTEKKASYNTDTKRFEGISKLILCPIVQIRKVWAL